MKKKEGEKEFFEVSRAGRRSGRSGEGFGPGGEERMVLSRLVLEEGS